MLVLVRTHIRSEISGLYSASESCNVCGGFRDITWNCRTADFAIPRRATFDSDQFVRFDVFAVVPLSQLIAYAGKKPINNKRKT